MRCDKTRAEVCKDNRFSSQLRVALESLGFTIDRSSFTLRLGREGSSA
ncbi:MULTISPECIES: hypothetical protein [Pseudothermotoga]|nr:MULTISPECIES: hypothetical protein [Pseudothermotoga]